MLQREKLDGVLEKLQRLKGIAAVSNIHSSSATSIVSRETELVTNLGCTLHWGCGSNLDCSNMVAHHVLSRQGEAHAV